MTVKGGDDSLKLSPVFEGKFFGLADLLEERRSIRRFSPDFVPFGLFSSLLWSIYGFTEEGRRVVPSAGAIYPMEVYVLARRVEGLQAGLYRYLPADSALSLVAPKDITLDVARSCVGGGRHVMECSFCLILLAFYDRICEVYGDRGLLYAHQESGHMAQNAYLAAAALGLGLVAVGAFDERRVRRAIGALEVRAEALYLLPVGFPAR